MNFITFDQWDDELWNETKFVYDQAFGSTGAKPEKIIRNMFKKRICYLQVLKLNNEVIGMALIGELKGYNALLIDYLAVREDFRRLGYGHKLLDFIKNWCLDGGNFDSLVIEVESEPTVENQKRIQFWEKNNFQLTEYIHQYIWVPEPYQAMFAELKPNPLLPTKGEELFQLISKFHKESYRAS